MKQEMFYNETFHKSHRTTDDCMKQSYIENVMPHVIYQLAS